MCHNQIKEFDSNLVDYAGTKLVVVAVVVVILTNNYEKNNRYKTFPSLVFCGALLSMLVAGGPTNNKTYFELDRLK